MLAGCPAEHRAGINAEQLRTVAGSKRRSCLPSLWDKSNSHA
jgi:hypothetical protein